MFIVAYGKEIAGAVVTHEAHECILRVNTLEEAKAARGMSGDLVFFAQSGKIVNHAGWLFDWEKTDSNCYARRCSSEGVRLVVKSKDRDIDVIAKAEEKHLRRLARSNKRLRQKIRKQNNIPWWNKLVAYKSGL